MCSSITDTCILPVDNGAGHKASSHDGCERVTDSDESFYPRPLAYLHGRTAFGLLTPYRLWSTQTEPQAPEIVCFVARLT